MNRNRLAEPVEIAGGGEKFYCYYSSDNESCQGGNDCDTTAERNNSLMVSVFGRRRDETCVGGELSYESCQDDR